MPDLRPLTVTVLDTNPTCPHCNCLLDRATSLETTESPSPGDLSICLNCASILVFTPQMDFIKISMNELDKMNKDKILSDKSYNDLLKARKFILKRKGN